MYVHWYLTLPRHPLTPLHGFLMSPFNATIHSLTHFLRPLRPCPCTLVPPHCPLTSFGRNLATCRHSLMTPHCLLTPPVTFSYPLH